MIRKIRQNLSQCHNVVIPEHDSKEGRYAKLLVEVDLIKPLLRGTKTRCNGDWKWVMFKYEQLPFFCFYCGLIGHGERSCEKKMGESKNVCLNEGQFEGWIRAP